MRFTIAALVSGLMTSVVVVDVGATHLPSSVSPSSLSRRFYSLDLSGHHNLQGTTILADYLDNFLETSDELESDSVVAVDLSSSALKDKDFERIVNVLFRNETTNSSSYSFSSGVHIQLTARFNQLTPIAVTYLIQRVLTDEAVKSNETLEEQRNNVTSHDESMSKVQPPQHNPRRWLESIDLCWNHLSQEARGTKGFQRALQQLLASRDRCPATIRLDRCGLGPAHCRSIAKGLMQRYAAEDDDYHESESDSLKATISPSLFTRPLSLHLSGNSAVGDAGAAALAAAIRTIVSHGKSGTRSTSISTSDPTIFDALDLSGCGIGDTGAEALALALESSTCCCIASLDLSNNKITSVGATSLGRALASSPSKCPCVRGIDLSYNKEVGDKGAAGIASAVGVGKLSQVALRSCGVYADGSAAFGKSLRQVALLGKSAVEQIDVDLSGNPLGVLRGKKKEEGKYSASRLKSKASATAASYMNQGMSFLKKNLKDVGVDVSPIFGAISAESDDEEEKVSTDLVDEDYDPSKGRCGAKSLANAFLETQNGETEFTKASIVLKRIKLGLRSCFFDHGAADALAALLVSAREDLGLELDMDVSLNTILEEEMVGALEGDKGCGDRLREMAERHQDAMQSLQEARARAAQATAAVAARVRARAEQGKRYEAPWDHPSGFGAGVEEEDEEWDSDADYDDEDTS